MTFEKIAEEAVALTERERAALAASLIDTLPAPGLNVTDKKIDRREDEMDSGSVEPISHDELVRRVQAERNR